MKKIQKIILAFMLGIVPLQSAFAHSEADELNLEYIKSLIEQGEMNAKDSTTILIIASGNGHLEIVKYLISKGADINAKNKFGGTALMFASDKGHLEIVKYLISKGANVNVVMSVETKGVLLYITALDSAIYNKHHKIVEVLKNAGAKTAEEIQK